MLMAEIPLFLALNAGRSTPDWVLGLARWCSIGLLDAAAGAFVVAWLMVPRMRRDLLRVLLSLLLACLIAAVMRHLWPAPRPQQLGLGLQWIIHANHPSFPSMHAAGAFAVAAALAGMRTIHSRWIWVIAFTLALAVAWSRVCLGLHLPSDVLAGAAVGVASAWLVSRLARHWGNTSAIEHLA